MDDLVCEYRWLFIGDMKYMNKLFYIVVVVIYLYTIVASKTNISILTFSNIL